MVPVFESIATPIGIMGNLTVEIVGDGANAGDV